jgi:hypothetical protein
VWRRCCAALSISTASSPRAHRYRTGPTHCLGYAQVPRSAQQLVLELEVDWSRVDFHALPIGGPRLCIGRGILDDGYYSSVAQVSLYRRSYCGLQPCVRGLLLVCEWQSEAC